MTNLGFFHDVHSRGDIQLTWPQEKKRKKDAATSKPICALHIK
jgi:hypothetical protein